MRFRRNRTKAHRSGAETLYDLFGWFDFIDWNWLSIFFERQQAAQVTFTSRLSVDAFGKSFVGVNVTISSRSLNLGNVQRSPRVLLSTLSPVHRARSFQIDDRKLVVFAIAKLVTSNRFGSENVIANAFDAAGRSRKSRFDHVAVEPDGFEDASAFVTGQCGDSHLGQNLQHAFHHTLAICRNALIGREFRVFVVGVMLNDRFKTKVRMNRIRTKASQQTVVVNFASFSCLHHDADSGSFVLFDQVMVHSTRRQQSTQWNSIRRDSTVAENHECTAVFDRLFRFAANSIER